MLARYALLWLLGFRAPVLTSPKISVPLLREPPPLLRRLLYTRQEEPQHFQEHIRQYNASLAFTSLGASRDSRFDGTHGNYVFKVSGEVRHWHGALIPEPEAQSAYVQIYFLESAAAAHARLQNPANHALRRSLLQDLHDMVTEVNPFVPLYQTAHERLLAAGAHQNDVSMRLHFFQHTDQWRYNLPTTSTEVAAILPYAHPQANTQDIILHLQNPPDGQFPLKCIHDCNPAYDPLHYVLLFPLGDLGWHDQMPQHCVTDVGHLTQNEYYSYQLHEHTDEPLTLLHGGRLFQQFVVDAWACIEQSQLLWFRHNQGKLRIAQLNGIMDAAHAGDDLGNVGQPFILPSSHIGSPQSMFQFCQDSYAIAAAFGPKPDLFITATANPQWEEILAALLPGQTWSDHPDIVTWVFHLKMEALLVEITKKGIFGRTLAHIYTIEFQKHGLPHMHLLIFLDAAAKPITPAQINTIVCAELPDPVAEPHLYNIVSKVMIHRPCGPHGNPNAVCIDKGKCTKGFPKPFSDETLMTADGYPTYCRCNTGPHDIHIGGQITSIDNRWVVPYNHYLSGHYESSTHIFGSMCTYSI
jgi:hypothetical protein